MLYNNFFFALKYLRTKWRALCLGQKEGGGGGTREATALILEMRADHCTVSSVAGSGNVFKIISKYRFNLACCLLAIFQTELTTALI